MSDLSYALERANYWLGIARDLYAQDHNQRQAILSTPSKNPTPQCEPKTIGEKIQAQGNEKCALCGSTGIAHRFKDCSG